MTPASRNDVRIVDCSWHAALFETAAFGIRFCRAVCKLMARRRRFRTRPFQATQARLWFSPTWSFIWARATVRRCFRSIRFTNTVVHRVPQARTREYRLSRIPEAALSSMSSLKRCQICLMIVVIAKCVNRPGEVFACLKMPCGMGISLISGLIEREADHCA